MKQIGDEHGPFDISLIDCGQYNSAWKHSHMYPKQAVMAAQDLGSKYFMPIHWGAFTLSTHDWADPVKRAVRYARKKEIYILTPEIGEIVILGNKRNKNWWEKN